MTPTYCPRCQRPNSETTTDPGERYCRQCLTVMYHNAPRVEAARKLAKAMKEAQHANAH